MRLRSLTWAGTTVVLVLGGCAAMPAPGEGSQASPRPDVPVQRPMPVPAQKRGQRPFVVRRTGRRLPTRHRRPRRSGTRRPSSRSRARRCRRRSSSHAARMRRPVRIAGARASTLVAPTASRCRQTAAWRRWLAPTASRAWSTWRRRPSWRCWPRRARRSAAPRSPPRGDAPMLTVAPGERDVTLWRTADWTPVAGPRRCRASVTSTLIPSPRLRPTGGRWP